MILSIEFIYIALEWFLSVFWFIMQSLGCTTCSQYMVTFCRSFPSVLWHCWLGYGKGIWPVRKTGCWFVGGDILTGALHVLYLQLLPPPPSPLAPVKSRMETLWYRLTEVHLENSHKNGRERGRDSVDLQMWGMVQLSPFPSKVCGYTRENSDIKGRAPKAEQFYFQFCIYML